MSKQGSYYLSSRSVKVGRSRPASGSGRLRGDPGADAIRVTWQTSFVGGPVAGALFVAVALEPAGYGAHLLDALYRRAAFPGDVDLCGRTQSRRMG